MKLGMFIFGAIILIVSLLIKDEFLRVIGHIWMVGSILKEDV